MKISAWAHDGKGRVDVISDEVKQIWLKVKPWMVEHYTIALYRLDDMGVEKINCKSNSNHTGA